MIVLIDNYDSFTYNLYQYISELGETVVVYRNDKISIEQIKEINPSKIVISPGPKRPDDAGISLDIIQSFYMRIPILGICLGHQCIGQYFGGKIKKAPELFHGKTSKITHKNDPIFSGLSDVFQVARYHSLIVDKGTIPDALTVIAETDDGIIMALKHSEYPIYGLQFHPESINTPDGKKILNNFLKAGESNA